MRRLLPQRFTNERIASDTTGDGGPATVLGIMSKSGNATKVGAVLVAVGASACWLPLLLVGLGAGATGAGAVFESLRPYLMAATVVLLGAAFYHTYRRKTVCATDGSSATTGPAGRAKAMLWGITAIAAVSFAFPYWSAARPESAQPGASSQSGSKAPTINTAYIEVKGMVQQLGIT